ncbi:MAG: hypothetical protein ABH863_04490 [Candidatus Micrarchaeota archaeon]
MANKLRAFKEALEFVQPTLEKISIAFFLLFVVLLALLLEIPEFIFLPLMTILAWPLLGLAQLCTPTDLECQNAASFVGLLASLIYWYLAACFLSWVLENQQVEEE